MRHTDDDDDDDDDNGDDGDDLSPLVQPDSRLSRSFSYVYSSDVPYIELYPWSTRVNSMKVRY